MFSRGASRLEGVSEYLSVLAVAFSRQACKATVVVLAVMPPGVSGGQEMGQAGLKTYPVGDEGEVRLEVFVATYEVCERAFLGSVLADGDMLGAEVRVSLLVVTCSPKTGPAT